MKPVGLLMIIIVVFTSQAGKCQTVSFSGKKVPLVDIFAVIKKQTGVFFFYDAALLQDIKPLTIDWKKVPLFTALNEIFKSQPLTWVLEESTITIVKRPGATATPGASSSQPPPPVAVNGIVSDGEGNPISGVSVIIKGSKKGVVSNQAGYFSVLADAKNTLVFSHVNYGPKEVKMEKKEMNVQLEMELKPLEVLLVGGNLTAMKRKADATSVTVLDSKTLEKIPVNTLDQLFRGWVPGVNSFNIGDAPEQFPTLSIRGANGRNSLEVISVYIDGIEYAGGSGYLCQLDKNNIDRIEVIRGPGAATMYGTGSNGGIVQIFTKKAKPGQNSINLTSSAGFYKSKWVNGNPFQQMHALETTTGLKNGSIKLGGSYRTIDGYLPDGGEKNKGFYGSARYSIGKLQVNIAARYLVRNFNLSRNPYYDTAINPRTDLLMPGTNTPIYEWYGVKPAASRNKHSEVETIIYGLHLAHQTTKNWVNNLDAGSTMNSEHEEPLLNGAAPLQRQYFSNQFNITTLRYSNILTLQKTGNDFEAIVSSGVEYKKYSNYSTITRVTTSPTVILEDGKNENYGAFVQLNPSYKNVYLTVGLRYEGNELFKPALNPRLGLTTNFNARYMILKPKISWGKGIVSPTYEQRFGETTTTGRVIDANPDLKPQSQHGFDYGIEIYSKKNRYKFEIVYYNNILQDMIAEGGIDRPMFINVAKVANKGWEFSGEYQVKRFQLQGTFSTINSILKDSTGTYISSQLDQLSLGDRLVNLPKHTAGLSLTYNFYKLFRKADKGVIAVNCTQVGGVEYNDYRKYTLDIAYGRTPFKPGEFGDQVENTVYRVGLYIDYAVNKECRFFVQGGNILNSYKYEYSSLYPTHGATWLFGLKYNFNPN